MDTQETNYNYFKNTIFFNVKHQFSPVYFPFLFFYFHGNCLDIYLELLKVHRFKVIYVLIMSHIASYRNQNQEIAQRLIEVATCDDEFFLLFATLNKVPKNTKTGLSPKSEKLSLNTTSLYN